MTNHPLKLGYKASASNLAHESCLTSPLRRKNVGSIAFGLVIISNRGGIQVGMLPRQLRGLVLWANAPNVSFLGRAF